MGTSQVEMNRRKSNQEHAIRLPEQARGLYHNGDSSVRNEIWIAREVLLVSVSRSSSSYTSYGGGWRGRTEWTDTPAIVDAATATVAFGFAALPPHRGRRWRTRS